MKYKTLFLFVSALATIVSGCIDLGNSQKTSATPEIIQGEPILVEMPAVGGDTWNTRVYRFNDTKVNSTCYIIPGGVNVNTISCVK